MTAFHWVLVAAVAVALVWSAGLAWLILHIANAILEGTCPA